MRTDAFALRHIGPSENDLQHMFKTIGVDSLEQLIYETVPDNILLKNPLNLDAPLSEYEYLNHIQELGKKNKVFKSYIGLGYHPTVIPAVIQRNIFENPVWYTAYTPSQPEIAQYSHPSPWRTRAAVQSGIPSDGGGSSLQSIQTLPHPFGHIRSDKWGSAVSSALTYCGTSSGCTPCSR